MDIRHIVKEKAAGCRALTQLTGVNDDAKYKPNDRKIRSNGSINGKVVVFLFL